jgi:hypothetical protein
MSFPDDPVYAFLTYFFFFQSNLKTPSINLENLPEGSSFFSSPIAYYFISSIFGFEFSSLFSFSSSSLIPPKNAGSNVRSLYGMLLSQLFF